MSERMSEDMSERMSEDMSERMREDMSERMPKDMSKRMSGDMSERMAQDMSERMSERMSKDMSERMSEDMPERMSKDMSQRMSGDIPEDIAERMSKDMSERMSEDMPKRMSEDMSEEMSERYVRRYVRNNVKRKVRKNGERYVRKNVRKICQKICHQKECQKICQKEWQKIRQKDVRKNVRRYVLSERMSEDMSGRTSENMSQVYVHTQIWITRIHVCTNGILWMASCFLFYLAYCSKYCWLNFVFVQGSEFGLEAMAEVVVERPETIFIGTANQVAKGVEHVWRYKLTFVGAERMYVCMEPPSTTHAGDLMFIMEEVVEGNKWYVAYEGRPVPNAEGEQELEKRAAVFRTSASFWEDGVHEWETNNVRSRATYAEPAQAPQWRASDFMVCTRHEM